MSAKMTPATNYALCAECASSVYASRAPTEAYAARVARLLFGTAAHESAGFRHSRQMRFSSVSPRGGWSWWQLEWGSISDSLHRLDGNEALATNAARFLCTIDAQWFRAVEPQPG